MSLAKLLVGIGPSRAPSYSEERGEGEADPLVEMAAEEVMAAVEAKDTARFVRAMRAFMRACASD